MKNTCFIGTPGNQSCTKCFARDSNSCGHHLSLPLSGFKRHCFLYNMAGDVYNTAGPSERQSAQNISVDHFHLLNCCLDFHLRHLALFAKLQRVKPLHHPCQLLRRRQTPTSHLLMDQHQVPHCTASSIWHLQLRDGKLCPCTLLLRVCAHKCVFQGFKERFVWLAWAWCFNQAIDFFCLNRL